VKPRSANDQHEARAFAIAGSIVLRGLLTEWCVDDIVGMFSSVVLDLAEEETDPVKAGKLNALVTYLDASPSVEDD
jgi:hypothetical protein